MASLTGFIEGRFYDPAQLVRLKAHAHSPLDAAIYALAADAGPRLSEISALKVRNVDGRPLLPAWRPRLVWPFPKWRMPFPTSGRCR